MREKNRNSIASYCILPQFTTMNVIDGQAVIERKFSLIFYSLTIDNILNIIVLLILAGVSIATLTGENGVLTKANDAKTESTIGEEKEAIRLAYNGAMIESKGKGVTAENLNKQFSENGPKAEPTGEDTINIEFETGRSYTVDVSTGKITGPTKTEEGTGGSGNDNEGEGSGGTGDSGNDDDEEGLITFSLVGLDGEWYDFSAKKGMTWEEWWNSEYGFGGWTNEDSETWVYCDNDKYEYALVMEKQPDEHIEDKGQYLATIYFNEDEEE